MQEQFETGEKYNLHSGFIFISPKNFEKIQIMAHTNIRVLIIFIFLSLQLKNRLCFNKFIIYEVHAVLTIFVSYVDQSSMCCICFVLWHTY
jgi:hypothetical protein